MRTYILKLSSVFLLLPMCAMAYSQEWLPINETKQTSSVTQEVLLNDASSFQVEITINGVYKQLLSNENGSFVRLTFDKGGTLHTPGDPALPFLHFLLAIPPGTRVSPSIREEQWVDVGVPFIYPAQEQRVDWEQPDSFVLNEQTYGQPFLPPLVSMGEVMNWRGIDNVGLSVCPFKYYPQSGRLSVLSSFVLQVDFVAEDENQQRLQAYEDRNCNLFDNRVFVEQENQSLSNRSGNYDLLIIAGSTTILNSDKMKEFRRWKALKGIKSKAVSTSVTGTSETSIKNYILQETGNGVQYVLFVDNGYLIPLKYKTSYVNPSKTIYSDYWYGCLGGDDDREADLPIGRFPTNTLSEFANMVDKTIRYEMGQNLSNKVLLVAHKDGAADAVGYQSCCEYIRTSYSGNTTFYKAYGASTNGGNNATNADVINYINQGVHIVNYRGHGHNNYWGGFAGSDSIWNDSGETFYDTEISNMNNNTNAVFFSVSCNTGNGMLGTFTRSPKGASAFVGSTSNSYTMPNHAYDINLFAELYDEGTYRLGDVNMNAHVYNIQTFSPESPFDTNLATDNAFSYLCGGDPTLEIWTDNPHPVNGVNMYSSGNSVTVTGLSSAYSVCVSTLDGDLVGMIPVTGSSCTFSKPASRYYISVIRHNYVPFVVYCDSESNTLQDVTLTGNRFYDGTPFAAGEYVDMDENIGDVILESGSHLFIQNGNGGVLLDAGFKCETGGMLQIK